MTKAPKGLLRVGDSVVAHVSGGEPVEGCETVSLLVHGSTRMEIMEKARAIGVFSPVIAFEDTPTLDEARLAVRDPDGVVWRLELNDAAWHPLCELPDR